MALTVFAASTAPLPSQLDASFAAIGAMQVTACRATGTNSITLTPLANQPAVGAYANYMQFGFVSVGMSTATVTVQVGSLPQLNLYLADGITQAGNGHLIGAVIYIIVYNSALGSAGGFQIVSQMPVSSLLDVLGTSQGSVLYRNATAWTTLPPGVKGSQLKSGGASGNPFWALSQTQVIHTISFTSAGAFSFSSPSGLGASKVVKLTLVGGGGGGGFSQAGANGGGGGGAGAVAIAYISGINANTVYSGAVGIGGNGAVFTGTTSASAGGTTTISFGGVQFTAAGGGRGRNNGSGNADGGSGGGATNVLISVTGAPGWNGSPGAGIGGAGANGPLGGGSPWSNGAAGIAARGAGSGGGGDSGKSTGGKGSNGLVLMEWIE